VSLAVDKLSTELSSLGLLHKKNLSRTKWGNGKKQEDTNLFSESV
jgi:hypothetical protein